MKPRRYEVKFPVVLAIALVNALLIAALSVYLQPGAFRTSLYHIVKTPSLIVLNLLPVVLVLGTAYCLCGNVFAASAAADFLFAGLSYANLLKLECRNDPVIPADLTLLREGLNAMGEYELDLHLFYLALILGSVAFFVILAVFVRLPAPRRRFRLPAAAALCAVLALLVSTVYADKDYYNALPDVDKSNVSQVFNTYGFTYCFLHNWNLYPVDKPAGYSAREAKAWEEEKLPAAQSTGVNVIFVMGEAYTDLSDEEAFLYPEEENPTYGFHQIADSDRAVSGHILVSGFGAGTANTEFDVMTGCQTTLLTETGNASAFRVIHSSTPSLARIYNEAGYHSWFMHPGYDWFYNRTNVYDWLGIQDQTFQGDMSFDPEEYFQNFLSDDAFRCALEAGLEERSGSPLFTYCVTIENHQAYTYAKYGDALTEEIPTTAALSEEAEEQLRVYFQGVRHTSEMLVELTAYLDEVDTPTVLVFFGDHRPALGGDYLAYREVGSRVGGLEPEDVLYTYETPFFIWSNRAMADAMDVSAAIEALRLPESGRINASYLGAVVYKLTGMTGRDAYMDYLTQAWQVLPVSCHGAYLSPEGEATDVMTEEQNQVLTKLHRWQYYRLRG